jgi:hypothetical protein
MERDVIALLVMLVLMGAGMGLVGRLRRWQTSQGTAVVYLGGLSFWGLALFGLWAWWASGPVDDEPCTTAEASCAMEISFDEGLHGDDA